MKKISLVIILLFSSFWLHSLSKDKSFNEAENLYYSGNYLFALEAYTDFLAAHPLSDQAAEAQYRQGLCLFYLKRYTEALDVFSGLSKRYPSNPFSGYVLLWSGISLYNLGNFPESITELSDFLDQISDPELIPQALLYRSLSGVALNDFPEAVAGLESLVEEYPDSATYGHGVIVLLYSYLKTGRYDDLLLLAQEISAGEVPEKWQDHYQLYIAEALWEKAELLKAKEIYQRLLDAPAEVAAVAFRRLFIIAQREHDLSQMEKLIQSAEERFSHEKKVLMDLWLRAGIESYKRDNLALAEYFLLKIWGLPDRQKISEAVPLYLAEIYVKREEIEEALTLLQSYLKVQDSAAALMRLADLYLALENYEQAVEYYQRFMEEYPRHERYNEAGYLLCYSYYCQDVLDNAEVLTAKLIENMTGDSYRKELMRLTAAIARKKGEAFESAARLKEYITLYPQDISARIDYLKILFSLEGYRETIEESEYFFNDFPLISEQDPYAFIITNYLNGLAQVSEKKYYEAEQSLAQVTEQEAAAAELSLIYPYSLFYRGWAFFRLGQYEKAEEQLLLMLNNPVNELVNRSLYLLGWCLFSRGEFAEASIYFARLAKTNTEYAPRASYLQGKSALKLGQEAEAARIFKNLMTVSPTSVYADDALFEYAGIKADSGKLAEASSAYRELVRRYPESPLAEEALYKRGEMYLAKKMYEEAKGAFYDYRKVFPDGELADGALYWGGEASLKLGENFGAVLYWEKLIEAYRESPFRAAALKESADVYAGRADYKQALDLLKRLIEEYPVEARATQAEQRAEELKYLLQGLTDREAALSALIGREGGAKTRKGREAMIELARLYIYEGGSRTDFAFQMLERVIEKEDRESAATAQFLIGEFYYRRGELIKAAGEFLQAAFIYPEGPDLMAASIFRAAEMMSLAGKEREVRELVERLDKNFPDSQWTEEGRKLLKRGDG
jgi:TolA-binding protein